MHIEILSEDKSGAYVVERLTREIITGLRAEADIAVRPHRGCGSLPKDLMSRPSKFTGSLLDLLPAKCRAYNNVYKGTDMILVAVMDSDQNDPNLLRQEMYAVMHKFAPDIRSVVGLCTEEIEAWLLGDRDAVRRAYPGLDERVLFNYEQDSICGTWETLCRVIEPDNADELIDIGYPAIGHYKSKWALTIAKYMHADNNVSPSFINYRNSIETAVRRPGPIARPAASVRRITF
ncbi:MAG: hypothetical protein J5685_10915 [Clostridiales bacterium]|nr:hypothetical protein [Clostridiales bacterium]